MFILENFPICLFSLQVGPNPWPARLESKGRVRLQAEPRVEDSEDRAAGKIYQIFIYHFTRLDSMMTH